MLELDLYCFARTSSADALASVASGSGFGPDKFRLDGTDGFRDADFERRGLGTKLVFVAIRDLGSLPLRAADFDVLPVIEAKIIEPHMRLPLVQVLSVGSLGAFVRSNNTGASLAVDDLPVGELGVELHRLVDEARLTKAALWVKQGAVLAKDEVRALYVTANDTALRCLVLRTNAVSSQVFELEPSLPRLGATSPE